MQLNFHELTPFIQRTFQYLTSTCWLPGVLALSIPPLQGKKKHFVRHRGMLQLQQALDVHSLEVTACTMLERIP